MLVACLLLGAVRMATHSRILARKPADRGAWWAAVHGVTQSQTGLTRLSMHACVGEGNGNPLPDSYLQNSVDRGAWWAAVHGVEKSQT